MSPLPAMVSTVGSRILLALVGAGRRGGRICRRPPALRVSVDHGPAKPPFRARRWASAASSGMSTDQPEPEATAASSGAWVSVSRCGREMWRSVRVCFLGAVAALPSRTTQRRDSREPVPRPAPPTSQPRPRVCSEPRALDFPPERSHWARHRFGADDCPPLNGHRNRERWLEGSQVPRVSGRVTAHPRMVTFEFTERKP